MKTTPAIGDKIVHVPTGSLGVVRAIRPGFAFCDFGSKNAPHTWVANGELAPEYIAPPAVDFIVMFANGEAYLLDEVHLASPEEMAALRLRFGS